MGCVSRYPGCLSPRSYVESCAQIPAVYTNSHVFHSAWQLLLGSSPSCYGQLWACGPSAAKRGPTACVFGRLAHSSLVTSTGSTACQFSHQGFPAPGLDQQLRQVRAPSQPNLRLHWHAVRHTHTHRGAPTQDGQQHAESLEVLALGHGLGPSQALGDPKLYGNWCQGAGCASIPFNSGPRRLGARRRGSGRTWFWSPPQYSIRWLGGPPLLYSAAFDWVRGSQSWHSTQTPHVTDGVHSIASALSMAGLGSNTYLYLYLYLNTQISVFVFVFVFEKPQDEIFVFVFVFDWRIWVYLTNIFQIHFSFLHFNT